MKCINCGHSATYEECYTCYRIRSGMKISYFYMLCGRICTSFPVHKKKSNFKFPRPVAHPLCKSLTCASSQKKYRNLIDHKGSNSVYIDEKTFQQIIKKPCVYCGIKAGGLDRVKNNIGYRIDNVVPCCAQCNYMKKDLSLQKFVAAVCRVHGYQQKKNVQNLNVA